MAESNLDLIKSLARGKAGALVDCVHTQALELIREEEKLAIGAFMLPVSCVTDGMTEEEKMIHVTAVRLAMMAWVFGCEKAKGIQP